MVIKSKKYNQIKDECGYEIHMIYNSLLHDPKFVKLFEKFDDAQYFFK